MDPIIAVVSVSFYIRSHPLFLEDFRVDKRAVSLPVSVYFSPGRAKTHIFITPNEVHTVAITWILFSGDSPAPKEREMFWSNLVRFQSWISLWSHPQGSPSLANDSSLFYSVLRRWSPAQAGLPPVSRKAPCTLRAVNDRGNFIRAMEFNYPFLELSEDARLTARRSPEAPGDHLLWR